MSAPFTFLANPLSHHHHHIDLLKMMMKLQDKQALHLVMYKKNNIIEDKHFNCRNLKVQLFHTTWKETKSKDNLEKPPQRSPGKGREIKCISKKKVGKVQRCGHVVVPLSLSLPLISSVPCPPSTLFVKCSHQTTIDLIISFSTNEFSTCFQWNLNHMINCAYLMTKLISLTKKASCYTYI